MSDPKMEVPCFSEKYSPFLAALLTNAHCGLVQAGMSDEEADQKVRSVFLRYYNLLFDSGARKGDQLEPWLQARPQSD